MFKTKTHRSVVPILWGVACLATPAVSSAATAVKLSGAITGVVNNSAGVPQMGATVWIYNRQDKPLQKLLTDDHGEFKFAGLLPELYSVRVSLATFLPAFKRDIRVQAGMRSVLRVNLSAMFSAIQLSYPSGLETGSIMGDDWKWVLRSASATR